MTWKRTTLNDALYMIFTSLTVLWGIFMCFQMQQMVLRFRKRIALSLILLQYFGLICSCSLIGYFIYVDDREGIPDTMYNSFLCAPIFTGMQIGDSVIFILLTDYRLFMFLNIWKTLVGKFQGILCGLVMMFNFFIVVGFVAVLTTADFGPDYRHGSRSCVEFQQLWLSYLFGLLGPFLITANGIFLWPFIQAVHFFRELVDAEDMDFTIRTTAIFWSCSTVSIVVRWCYFFFDRYEGISILISIANSMLVNILMFGAFASDQENLFSSFIKKIVGKSTQHEEESIDFKRRIVNRLSFLQEQPGLAFASPTHTGQSLHTDITSPPSSFVSTMRNLQTQTTLGFNSSRRFSGSLPADSTSPVEPVEGFTPSPDEEKGEKKPKFFCQASLSNVSMTRSRDTNDGAPDSSEMPVKPPVFNTLPFNNWRRGYIILPLCIIPKIDNIVVFLELADGTLVSIPILSILHRDILRSKIVLEQEVIDRLAKRHRFSDETHVMSVEEWDYFKLYKSFYRDDWQVALHE